MNTKSILTAGGLLALGALGGTQLAGLAAAAQTVPVGLDAGVIGITSAPTQATLSYAELRALPDGGIHIHGVAQMPYLRGDGGVAFRDQCSVDVDLAGVDQAAALAMLASALGAQACW